MCTKLQRYTDNIHIIDNKSIDKDTIQYLKVCDYNVIYMKKNYGHMVLFNNKELYDSLPNFFALSDPDLELNDNMPYTFLETLKNATIKYDVYKAGLALDISDFDKMYQEDYYPGKSLKEIESRYWKNRIKDDKYEIYDAAIDTTFAVYNKQNKHKGFFSAVRYADDFTCKHIPWYVDNWIYSKKELTNLVYKKYVVDSHVKDIIMKKS